MPAPRSIAIADRLPSFPLVANAAARRLHGSAVHGGHRLLGRGRECNGTPLPGRATLHQERAAKAAYTQAAAQYRSTVLAAFQNVADTLTALEQDAEALQRPITRRMRPS